MLIATAFVLSILTSNIPQSVGRLWKEATLKHDMNQADLGGLAFLKAKELQLLEESRGDGSTAPNISHPPASPTTNVPSPIPSINPTSMPTIALSDPPTLIPSGVPSSLPSANPSLMPSKDPYSAGAPPHDKKKGYFDYNLSSYEGPNNWGSIELPDNYYWSEFDNIGFGTWKGILFEREPWENDCRRGRRQSPIDVRENGAVCDEFHEIRDKPGIYKLTDPIVEKKIESNKLRIVYPRRVCHNVSHPWYSLDPLCQQPSPPTGDFPNGWKGTGDVIHIDFKVPGEHKIWGESFDGEMQIFHIHPVNQRVVGVATMVRAEIDGFNFYLQELLNVFQRIYDQNQADCQYFLQNGHGSRAADNFTSETYVPTASPTVAGHGGATVPPRHLAFGHEALNATDDEILDVGTRSRDLQVRFVWNPYHAMLIPTIYFYRYDGSITEPPCAEMVSWFVSDEPMIISFEQLQQWKNIQFTNVDQTCQMTSVHSEQSVARPIQPTYDRPVWKCTSENFVADPK